MECGTHSPGAMMKSVVFFLSDSLKNISPPEQSNSIPSSRASCWLSPGELPAWR